MRIEYIFTRNINSTESSPSKRIIQSKAKVKKVKSKHPFRELWRWMHRWIGLIISIFLLIFAISGIILNHREELSFLDVPRAWMPSEYHYINWNNAAVKSILHTKQGVFVYGNIGVWKKVGDKFINFNYGFPRGADNRNVHSMIESPKGSIFAATLLGFYQLDSKLNKWTKVNLPTVEQRIVKLVKKEGIIYALTRNRVIKIIEDNDKLYFDVLEIKEPVGYEKKVSLFDTLWQIHSGEIFGLPGKLFMDFIGLVFIILVISGFIKWYYPKLFKSQKIKSSKLQQKKQWLRFNLRWHNRLGLWFGVILIISAITGMFLRPPMLILIANSKVSPLPHTNLNQNNPWHDKLRNITWSDNYQKWIFATNEKLYLVDKDFLTNPIEIKYHPPISVMGVNVLEQTEYGGILVGSFSGLFLWYPSTNLILDYVQKKPAEIVLASGPPIGMFAVSGYGWDEFGKEYYFDYNLGAIPLNSNKFFAKMSNEILENSKMSLWNAMLEFHTGRIFKAVVDDFYILIVPLVGLLTAITSISGLILWFWIYKGKKI